MFVGPVADPWVQAEIDKAIAPYTGRLPAEELAWMRERLVESLAIERAGASLLRRARPRFVEASGEVGRDGRPSSPGASGEAELNTKRGRQGGGR